MWSAVYDRRLPTVRSRSRARWALSSRGRRRTPKCQRRVELPFSREVTHSLKRYRSSSCWREARRVKRRQFSLNPPYPNSARIIPSLPQRRAHGSQCGATDHAARLPGRNSKLNPHQKIALIAAYHERLSSHSPTSALRFQYHRRAQDGGPQAWRGHYRFRYG